MRSRAAILILACACARPVDLSRAAPATLSQEPPGYELATVTEVVDGDTLEVTITGRSDGAGAGRARVGHRYDVRLLGIDTPETVHPDRPVECFGREASAAMETLVEGEEVRLVDDVEEVDRYGRLLRYVYLDQELVNARLVLNGYATALVYEPNDRHAVFLADLQRSAREADRGLWGPETCNGDA